MLNAAAISRAIQTSTAGSSMGGSVNRTTKAITAPQATIMARLIHRANISGSWCSNCLALKDPIFANVRGYQIAGTNFVHPRLNAPSWDRSATDVEGDNS